MTFERKNLKYKIFTNDIGTQRRQLMTEKKWKQDLKIFAVGNITVEKYQKAASNR